MKITFDENAKAVLDRNKSENDAILLDLDDGVGMFSKVGQCSLDTSFRILLVDKTVDFQQDYSGVLDSNVGPVFVKPSSDYYLKDDITFKVKENSTVLQMSSPAELIDGRVGIEHIEKAEV